MLRLVVKLGCHALCFAAASLSAVRAGCDAVHDICVLATVIAFFQPCGLEEHLSGRGGFRHLSLRESANFNCVEVVVGLIWFGCRPRTILIKL